MTADSLFSRQNDVQNANIANEQSDYTPHTSYQLFVVFTQKQRQKHVAANHLITNYTQTKRTTNTV